MTMSIEQWVFPLILNSILKFQIKPGKHFQFGIIQDKSSFNGKQNEYSKIKLKIITKNDVFFAVVHTCGINANIKYHWTVIFRMWIWYQNEASNLIVEILRNSMPNTNWCTN